MRRVSSGVSGPIPEILTGDNWPESSTMGKLPGERMRSLTLLSTPSMANNSAGVGTGFKEASDRRWGSRGRSFHSVVLSEFTAAMQSDTWMVGNIRHRQGNRLEQLNGGDWSTRLVARGRPSFSVERSTSHAEVRHPRPLFPLAGAIDHPSQKIRPQQPLLRFSANSARNCRHR